MGILNRRWFRIVGATCVVVFVAFYSYHRSHPLVFGEAFFFHERCINQATSSLNIHATENRGIFPYHTNGFGDAILLVEHAWLPSFTGPGYSVEVFEQARNTSANVPEDECGRIYVQGLSKTNGARIAIIFDRHPSPGDHTHGFARFCAQPVREVGFIDGSMRVIPAGEWSAFVAEQVELLVSVGFSGELAQSYYR